MKIFSLIASIMFFIFCFINIGVFFFIERETVWLALASADFLLGGKYYEDWRRYRLEKNERKWSK